MRTLLIPLIATLIGHASNASSNKLVPHVPPLNGHELKCAETHAIDTFERQLIGQAILYETSEGDRFGLTLEANELGAMNAVAAYSDHSQESYPTFECTDAVTGNTYVLAYGEKRSSMGKHFLSSSF